MVDGAVSRHPGGVSDVGGQVYSLNVLWCKFDEAEMWLKRKLAIVTSWRDVFRNLPTMTVMTSLDKIEPIIVITCFGDSLVVSVARDRRLFFFCDRYLCLVCVVPFPFCIILNSPVFVSIHLLDGLFISKNTQSPCRLNSFSGPRTSHMSTAVP